MSSETSKAKKPADPMRRGVKRHNPVGNAMFVGLRAADPLFQYGILAKGLGSSLLRRLGLEILQAGPPNTGTFLDALGLSPYRLVLFSMAAGASAKQIYWALGVAEVEIYPGLAVATSAHSLILNTISNLAFTCSATSASMSGPFPQVPLIVGSLLYVAGMTIEGVSEHQRRNFKKDPKNKGKAFTGGLFSLARHINYTGHCLWRCGPALAAAGWIWGGIVFSAQLSDFIFRGVPAIDEYCSNRYGVQWAEFKKNTPYKLIPYVY